jgi:hypothetical protein
MLKLKRIDLLIKNDKIHKNAGLCEINRALIYFLEENCILFYFHKFHSQDFPCENSINNIF